MAKATQTPPADFATATAAASNPERSGESLSSEATKETGKGGSNKAVNTPVAEAQAMTAPPSSSGRFRVTLGDQSVEVTARDADEAWALFCDGQKKWPSRKFAKPTIEPVE